MDEVLYHYCTTSTFLKIIQNQSIRLSSLKMSSDWLEGRVVNKTFLALAKKDGFPIHLLRALHSAFSTFEEVTDGLGLCLSREGDLLSQWRGYADDGQGVAIGFSKEYLKNLGIACLRNHEEWFDLVDVRYTKEEHEQEIEPAYQEIKKLVARGAFTEVYVEPNEDEEHADPVDSANHAAFTQIARLASRFFTLKTFAFHEERESRLVMIFTGTEEKTRAYYVERGNRVVPCIDFQLKKPEQAIAVVKLGPKHQTSPRDVELMLKRAGFGDVKVQQSSATYR